MMIFEPLQHANVRQPERAAAFQGHANRGARLFFRTLRRLLLLQIVLRRLRSSARTDHRS
jgi:hypothetical protein